MQIAYQIIAITARMLNQQQNLLAINIITIAMFVILLFHWAGRLAEGLKVTRCCDAI